MSKVYKISILIHETRNSDPVWSVDDIHVSESAFKSVIDVIIGHLWVTFDIDKVVAPEGMFICESALDVVKLIEREYHPFSFGFDNI